MLENAEIGGRQSGLATILSPEPSNLVNIIKNNKSFPNYLIVKSKSPRFFIKIIMRLFIQAEKEGFNVFFALDEQKFYLIIVFLQVKQQGMKGIFAPAFNRRESENSSKTAPAFLLKSPQSPCEKTVKKMSFHVDGFSNLTELSFPRRFNSITQVQSKNSDQQNSCKSSQTIIFASKAELNLVKQPRTQSPPKYPSIALIKRPQSPSPNNKQSRIGLNNFAPMRATMKNLPMSKSPILNIKNQTNNAESKDIKVTSSKRVNRTLSDIDSMGPGKNIEKELLVLKQQNECLKKQLNEIKKNFGLNAAFKKEDLISNLRDTIKKQDNQIKQLRVKIDIATKKNSLLTTLLETKDEEITYLSSKIMQVENELREHKKKNAEKFEKLKERINFMITSYGDLEVKWNQAEMQWLDFKEKWNEEKEIYLQRITFLEQYIADCS